MWNTYKGDTGLFCVFRTMKGMSHSAFFNWSMPQPRGSVTVGNSTWERPFRSQGRMLPARKLIKPTKNYYSLIRNITVVGRISYLTAVIIIRIYNKRTETYAWSVNEKNWLSSLFGKGYSSLLILIRDTQILSCACFISIRLHICPSKPIKKKKTK